MEAKIDDLGNRAAIAMQEGKERAAQADRAIADIEKRVINVELNTNRKNILITGIPEVCNERCHLTVQSFFNDHLHTEEVFDLEACFRLGRYREGYSYPILIIFLRLSDREYIKKRDPIN